ncbi:MAG: O-antigen ligase family protein, partial [Anaerolineae bacterium]|nr:O-antigen ligase family protein [Anaerolineae bacterium]
MNSSRLSQICDTVLEAGWLLGVTVTPVFFNVYSSRVFEPDKLTTLRAISIVLAVFWLVRFIEERMQGERALRFSLKTPMVLPALLLICVYLVSSIFSLVPFTSFIGSYQRLQGTLTLFSYLVIFFVILTSLRTREQLSRLITVLILNSLPVSLYGIVQHSGLDPLPWAGDVTSRVASNMGNAIFVAAYLILVVPITASRIVESFRDILSREDARVSDILRASGYIFVLAVQLLTIWYSQSRGPWLGTVAAVFLFPYLGLLLLQRQAGPGPQFGDILRGVGFGFSSLILSGGLALFAYWAIQGQIAIYVALGLALLLFGGMWLYFIVERKGWRWLWIGWGSVGLTVALALILINVPGPLQTQARKVPSLRRLTTITELQSSTGRVRGLIWQGAVKLISVHEPIKFPDGTEDQFNFLRPLVGYGPESMYVAYNSFYPPELGHYESRTASPDRSHNETLDSLVITGVLGLAVYLFTFVSFFAWGFHWLGLLNSRFQLLTYIGLDILFAVLFFIIAWRLEGAYLFAVAIPLGVLVGTMVYLTVAAFIWLFQSGESKDSAHIFHPHTILL